MPKLSEMKCEACRDDSQHVTHEEVKELLQQTPGWQVSKKDEVNRLEKVYFFRDWSEAIAFTNQVGEIAEEQGHHPLIITEWGRVTVQWWTHKIRGLHQNDFVMAAKTEELATAAATKRAAEAAKK